MVSLAHACCPSAVTVPRGKRAEIVEVQSQESQDKPPHSNAATTVLTSTNVSGREKHTSQYPSYDFAYYLKKKTLHNQ